MAALEITIQTSKSENFVLEAGLLMCFCCCCEKLGNISPSRAQKWEVFTVASLLSFFNK
jgi:hypothetical protein